MNTIIIEINARPDIVFSWLDEPHKLQQWLPNIVENEVLQEVEGGVGTTWRQVYEESGRRMEMFGELTLYQPGKRLSCAMTGKMFDLDIDYLLEDLGGRTRLTQHSVVKMKGLFKILALFMSKMMKKSQENQADESFSTLKKLAEQEAGAAL